MEKYIRQDKIIGSRCFSNYFWANILALGGISFGLIGIESYFQFNLLPFFDSTEVTFIPQGIIMVFYGTISLVLSFYTYITIIFDIGSGYNEYNKIENSVRIVRRGFPGKNREILLTYYLSDINAIGIKISEGININQNIYLCLNDSRKIPITPLQQPNSISSLEEEAAALAQFLNLKLENL